MPPHADHPRDSPAGIGDLIQEIAADAGPALEDLRSLVHGIYPALLTDRGLPDALKVFDADDPAVSSGSGLANMADRLAAVGGRVKVMSAPGCGAVVQGWVPSDALLS